MAPRHILVFSDGTGNSSGKLFRTNVWRLYQAVDLADPAHPTIPRQFAYYDDGVGTSTFKPLALLGGAIGLGLGRNVRDLYAFVCRTYRPDDKIFAFGFSRGAFTVRVLVGLIMNQGLVPYDGSEAELQRNVAAAYRAYRRERFNTILGLERPIRWLRDRVYDLLDMLSGHTRYAELKRIGVPGAADEIHVQFVGVWDTVAAYGLPIDELTRAVDQYIWPLSMPDRDLSPRVDRAMHALALDDERNTFHPQLWNEGPSSDGLKTVDPPNGATPKTRIEDERLSQVWFAGVHSNIGGGYPDDTLSYVPLDWIMTGADKAGVRFVQKTWDQYRAFSDENGPIYDSRRGFGGYYRYNPRRIERLTNTDEVQIARTKIHESVFRRISVGQDGYAPIVPPPDFDVVRINGAIVSGQTCLKTPLGPTSSYAVAREHAFNHVWRRRIAYFLTLGATLLLAVMPLIWPALPKGACHSRLCFVSDIIDSVGAILPGFVSTWFDAFSSRPDVFLLIAAVIGLGLFAGIRLEVSARDAMRRIWYGIPATRPSSAHTFRAPAEPGWVGRLIERLRLSPGYIATFRFLTHRALPFAFLITVVYGAAALLAQSIFEIRSSWGSICTPSDNPQRVEARTAPLRIQTSAPCTATGFELKEAGTYRLTIAIPEDDPWRDASLPARPYGVDPHARGTGYLFLGVPFRRHLGQPWFKPMMRIGWRGSDDYPLHATPSLAKEEIDEPSNAGSCGCACLPGGEQRITIASEIVARSSGELFIYVNDAIFLPPLTAYFYRNNKGSACLTVEQIGPAP